MGISVQRLVHRGSARNLVSDRIGLEDALGTTVPDSGRLVLVRKLTVRGGVADPRNRRDAVQRGWVEAVSDAVHATSSFAGSANCVWFASHREAEAILLAKLLAGESAAAWFWRLAVPDWHGLPAAEWLPRQIAHALSEGDNAALARIAQACVERGGVELFVEAADRALKWSSAGAIAFPGPPASPASSLRDPEPAGAARDVLTATIAGKLLPRVLPPVWHRLVAAMERAATPGQENGRLITAILTERVRRASPALVLHPRLMREVGQALFEAAMGRLALPPVNAGEEGVVSAPAFAADLERPARRSDGLAGPGPLRQGAAAPHEAALVQAKARPRSRFPDAESGDIEPPSEMRSSHAGLWLVVPSLIRLGFREWMMEQTDLLAGNPGQQLIRAIALRHRVPSTDPALAMLDPELDGAIDSSWTETWRRALDRWLRHKTRRRIHDLVARPGVIVEGDERIDIRFPLASADLGLRRLALDRDPGWTDWLGLSIRYHFEGGAVQ